jgi:diacylglycerol kinase family enzyme
VRATLIVNPFASRVTEQRVREVEEELRPVETLLTERRGHATELAGSARGDAVWVLGGDGLVNEVVNGLRPGVPLGVVPAGHTNVLARALGLGLHGRQERPISVGRVNGRRFAFAAGIGVDSEAVRAMETERRAHEGRRPGDLTYARDVAERLLHGYEPRLDVRGFGRAAIVLVSTGPVFTYAGPFPLPLSPRARFESGLAFVAPARIDAAALARFVPRLVARRGLAGARGVLYDDDVDRIEVACDWELPLQADGEDLGDVTEAVFEVERGALSVLV